ncbi:hypothetical protein EKJ_20280 [Qipengyuania flava]|uniref:Uncharacterized protein n=1 Tax=Qipengyuania flava TaxID=192812 RepID=A0A3T1CJM5_9SPHN|nr:hypothetical protein EKJ_20280 [Qipengyuania flava]
MLASATCDAETNNALVMFVRERTENFSRYVSQYEDTSNRAAPKPTKTQAKRNRPSFSSVGLECWVKASTNAVNGSTSNIESIAAIANRISGSPSPLATGMAI